MEAIPDWEWRRFCFWRFSSLYASWENMISEKKLGVVIQKILKPRHNGKYRNYQKKAQQQKLHSNWLYNVNISLTQCLHSLRSTRSSSSFSPPSVPHGMRSSTVLSVGHLSVWRLLCRQAFGHLVMTQWMSTGNQREKELYTKATWDDSKSSTQYVYIKMTFL